MSHGGRVTLRLSESRESRVEYAGELAADGASWKVSASVDQTGGAVEIKSETDGDAPPWLVDLARAVLRTAWRGTKTGAAWPRRVNRWRGTKDGDD